MKQNSYKDLDEVDLRIIGFDKQLIEHLSDYSSELFIQCLKNPRLFLQSKIFESDIVNYAFKDKVYLNMLLDRIYPLFDRELTEFERCGFANLDLLKNLCLFAVRYLDYANEKLVTRLSKLFEYVLIIPEFKRIPEVYNFIVKYIVKGESERLNITRPMLIISNYRYLDEIVETEVAGSYNYRLNTITISESIINSSNPDIKGVEKLPYVIHTVFHELKHVFQGCDNAQNKYSNDALAYSRRLLFNKYISNIEIEFNDYISNYQYDEIEVEAEIFGWSSAYRLLNERNLLTEKDKSTMLDEINYNRYKKMIGMKIDEFGKMYPAYLYNINCLNRIVKKHSQEISRFPILKLFYDDQGNLNDFVKLIKLEKELTEKNDIKSSFMDYYRYLANEIIDIDYLLGLSSKDKTVVVSKIFDLLICDLEYLNNSFLFNYHSHSKDLEFISETRINSFIKLYNLMIILHSKLQEKDDKSTLLVYKQRVPIVNKLILETKNRVGKKINIQRSNVYPTLKRILKFKPIKNYTTNN